jgi:large subunit ribosomal protein L18
MKLVYGSKTKPKLVNRLKKKVRIRKVVSGTGLRPRLCVFRSSKHIYASIVNDITGQTVCSASSLKVSVDLTGKKLAEHIGSEIAKIALGKNIKEVVFDRNGYLYHGRIKSLADGARHGGLSF